MLRDRFKNADVGSMPRILTDSNQLGDKKLVHIAVDMEARGTWGAHDYVREVLGGPSRQMRALQIPQVWLGEEQCDPNTFDAHFLQNVKDFSKADFYTLKSTEEKTQISVIKLLQQYPLPDKSSVDFDRFFKEYPKARDAFNESGRTIHNGDVLLQNGQVDYFANILTGETVPVKTHQYVDGQSTDPNLDIFISKRNSNGFDSSSLPQVLQKFGKPEDVTIIFTGHSYLDCLPATITGALELGYNCIVIPEVTNFMGSHPKAGDECDPSEFFAGMCSVDRRYPFTSAAIDQVLLSEKWLPDDEKQNLLKLKDGFDNSLHVCPLKVFQEYLDSRLSLNPARKPQDNNLAPSST